MVDLRERVALRDNKREAFASPEDTRQRITVFQCVESAGDLNTQDAPGVNIKYVKMTCSSMVRDIYILKAFEAGADAVVVFTCPEGQCKHLDGNIRARKRVEKVKKLLADIGWDAGKLSIHQSSHEDTVSTREILMEIARKLLERSK